MNDIINSLMAIILICLVIYCSLKLVIELLSILMGGDKGDDLDKTTGSY